MALYTYSPKDITISIAGIYQVEGYAEDTFVTITKDDKPFDYKKAMNGSIARILRRDNCYTLKLRIQQTATTNDILSALHKIDLATSLGKFPLILKDHSGNTTLFTPNAWIENYPEAAFSGKIELREWEIKCTDAIYILGGNGDSDLATALNVGGTVADTLKGFGVF